MAKYRHEALAVVLQVRQSEDGARLSVLMLRRGRDPYAGAWALPSGPVEATETVGASVRRHLAAKVDLTQISHLEQLRTLSDPGRDPFERTIATAYLGLVPWTSDPELPDHGAWWPIGALPEVAFDHRPVIAEAVHRLRAKLSYTNIGFALAADEFTIAQLRRAYAIALDHEVSSTNLQRILLRRGQLEPTGEMSAPGEQGGRPAKLFRFTSRELEVTDPFAILRPNE